MRGKTTIAIACLLSSCLLAAGCGGGDDEASISKAEFVKQANALCAASQKKMQREVAASIKEAFGKKSSGAPAPSTEEVVSKRFQEQIDGIEDLNAPSNYEQQAEEVVAAMQRVADEAEESPAQFRRKAPVLYATSQRTAEKYGLDSCGVLFALRRPQEFTE